MLINTSLLAQIPSYIPQNGLVGWWPFNGNANDESGNGNNGINNGANLTIDRYGNLNKAYNFNGQSNFISVNGSNFNFPLNQSFSISIWVKNSNYCSDINYCGGFLSKQGITTNDNGIGFQVGFDNTNKVKFEYNTNLIIQPPVHFYNSSSLVVNNWSNIVCIVEKNNNQIRIYYNGVLEGTYNNSWISNSSSNSNPLYFGMLRGSNYFYNGALDDIGIWNRAISQQEITALYNSQSCTGTISADGPTTFCAGNYVYLTSDVVGGTYQWKKNGVNISTNATSRTYKATATGSYTCVANCNGSTLTSNAIVVTSKTNASAAVSASGATSFCAGDSVTLSATNLGSNYSVQWYRTNISMENANNYSQVVKQPGTYKVVTKNLTTGCSRISSSSVVVAVNCRISNPNIISVADSPNDNESMKINQDDQLKSMQVFPNPNKGSFTFEFQNSEEGEGELQILNSMGQSIFNAKVSTINGLISHKIDLGDHFNSGIYIIRFSINGKQYDSKVILQ
jgi:hypothetical protein